MSKTLQGSKHSGGSLHFSEISEQNHKDQNDFRQLNYQPRRDMTPRGYSKIQSNLNISREHKKSRQNPQIYSKMMFSNSNQSPSNY